MTPIEWAPPSKAMIFKLSCATGAAQLCGGLTALFALSSQEAYGLALQYHVSKIDPAQPMTYMDTIFFDATVRISSLVIFAFPGILVGFPLGWVLAKSVVSRAPLDQLA